MDETNFVPDFSGDDFAGDKSIQAHRAAIAAYNTMLDESFAIVRRSLHAEKASHKNLKDFLIFRGLKAGISRSLRADITGMELQVSMASYYSSYPSGKAGYGSNNEGTDDYLFGCFTGKKNFPHTYIQPEGIKEKISDLFLKQDVDFDNNKKFSRRFHVITEDSRRLKDIFMLKDLDRLAPFRNMEIELKDNRCLFRPSRKSVSEKEAKLFCELALALRPLLG